MINNELRIIDLTVAEFRELLKEAQPSQRPITNPATTKKKIGTDELCQRYGFAKSTVYFWVGQRFIPHSKPRKRLQFDVAEIEAWIESFKVKTKAEYLK